MPLFRELSHAVRSARKTPLFTATVVATLALTIGANTAILSLVDRVFLRALPYPEPDRLVEIATFFHGSEGDARSLGSDGRTWELLHERLRLVDLAVFSGFRTMGVNFAYRSEASLVQQQRVSAGFFRVLGVTPAVGREFTEAEDRPGGPAVAILSHDLWRRVFFEDRGVLGETVLVRGEPHVIVGILPQGFRTSVAADLWTPLRASTTGEGMGTNYEILGRRRDGVTVEQAAAEVEAVGREVLAERPLSPGIEARLGLVGLREGLTGDAQRPLLLLWGAVGAVLLIACVNVAGLFSARGVSRVGEMGTRLALGARPATLVRQLLTESLLYALLGGASGLLVGELVLRTMKRLAVESVPFLADLSLDFRAVVATGLVSLLACALFGIVPALRGRNVNLSEWLSGSHRIAGGKASRSLGVLAFLQVALAVPLLLAAVLLTRSFSHLWQLAPGFDGTNVITARISLQDARYKTTESVNELVERGLAKVEEIPDVESVGLGLALPYERWLNMPFRFEGRDEESFLTTLEYVTSGTFHTLDVPVLLGRTFLSTDDGDSEPVAVVSQSFVERYLRGREPLGEHLRMFDRSWRVVGVVADVQQHPSWDTDAPVAKLPTAYIPLSQTSSEFLSLVHTWFSPSFVVKTRTTSPRLTRAIQQALGELDPLLPPATMGTIDQAKSDTLALERLLTALFGAFGLLATCLAALGIYGVVANHVASRERELSVRLALGATRAQSIGIAVRPAMAFAAAGVALGLVLSFGGSRFMESLLWGVRPLDPPSLLGVFVGVVLLAAVASFLPAARVARMSPAQRLRED